MRAHQTHRTRARRPSARPAPTRTPSPAPRPAPEPRPRPAATWPAWTDAERWTLTGVPELAEARTVP